MVLVPNSQSFSPDASGTMISQLESVWETAIDTVLVGLGRNITLHLPPIKVQCPDPDCRYNSSYKRYMGSDGTICRSCRGEGFLHEPRQTIYKANIRWINDPLATLRNFSEFEVAGAGRVATNLVRTKTVAESFNHIKQSVGATIDGQEVELIEEQRYTSFVSNHYCVAFWKKAGR